MSSHESLQMPSLVPKGDQELPSLSSHATSTHADLSSHAASNHSDNDSDAATRELGARVARYGERIDDSIFVTPCVEEDIGLARAVAFIEDARHGCDPSHRISGIIFLRMLMLWHKCAYAYGFVGLLYLFLSYFEHPRTLGSFSPGACLCIEAAILVILGAQACFKFYAYNGVGAGRFWSNSDAGWRVAELVVLSLNLIDFVLYATFAVGHGRPEFVRFSRMIRPFYCLSMNAAARAQTVSTFRTLVAMVPKCLLICAYVGFMAIIGFVLFHLNTSKGLAYFGDYYSAASDLFVLLTLVNFPDVMLPPLASNRAYVIFFMVFLILGTMLGLNIVLGFNFIVYRRGRDEFEKAERARIKRTLALVFHCLADPVTFTIQRMRFLQLFVILRPDLGLEKGNDLFDQLDAGHSNTLFTDEFEAMIEHLFLSFPKPDRGLEVRSIRLWEIIESKGWSALMVLACLGTAAVNVWCLQFSSEIFDPRWPFFFDLCALIVLVLDVAAKCVVYGRSNLSSPWWRFDVFAVGSALLGKIVVEVILGNRPHLFLFRKSSDDLSEVTYTLLRYAVILRCFKMLSLMSVIKPLRGLIGTILFLVPQTVRFVGVIAMVFYSFAAIGIELFGGLLHSGNPDLAGTDYLALGYADALNFNSFGEALITCFVLLCVNNWMVFYRAATAVTTRWATIYFVLFYFLAVVIFLNLTIAFLLDSVAFHLELSKKKKRAGMQKVRG